MFSDFSSNIQNITKQKKGVRWNTFLLLYIRYSFYLVYNGFGKIVGLLGVLLDPRRALAQNLVAGAGCGRKPGRRTVEDGDRAGVADRNAARGGEIFTRDADGQIPIVVAVEIAAGEGISKEVAFFA